MALDIAIGTVYRIQSDDYNFIVNKRRIVNKQDGSKVVEWGTQNKYPKTMRAACELILHDHGRSSDAKSMKLFIEQSKEMNKLLRGALQVNGVEI